MISAPWRAGLAQRHELFGTGDEHEPLRRLVVARAMSRKRSHREVAAQSQDGTGNPLLDRLDPGDGRRLLALGCQLVWATTWMAEANEVISPRLGLPDLPVVEWPDDEEDPPRGLHWKTMFLTRWAAGRPFIWLDDELTDADRRWVAAHHPERALLQRVDPYAGVTDLDFATVRQWLEQGDRVA